MTRYTGGCQCGAVRFACDGLGRASVCHCRMCQKAFGNAFALLVRADGLVWTRGAPKRFASSDKVKRGFCADCGTPLTYEYEGAAAALAIGAFDEPGRIAPVLQVGLQHKLPWCDGLPALPVRTPEQAAEAARRHAMITSFQHPDHDTSEPRQ
jgi:hypothetical protein